MIKEIATDYTTSHLAFTDFPSVWDYQEDSKRGWQWTWNATEPSARLSEAHTRCNCFHNWPRTARKCIDQQWHWADIAISLTKALLRRCHEKKPDLKKDPKILPMTSSAVQRSQWYSKNIIWSVFLRARKSFSRDFQVFEDQNLPTVSRSTYNPFFKKKVNQMYSVTWNIDHYRKE